MSSRGKWKFLLHVLYLLVCTTTITRADNCTVENVCDCVQIEENRFEADCSNRHLSVMPKFGEDVIRIYMQNVGPISIYNTSNIPSNVQILDLSKNNINGLDFKTAFAGFPNLTRLDISSNVLALISLDFEGKTFEHLLSLKYLDMRRNSISSLPRSIFKGLENIDTLLLGSNWLRDMSFDIEHMKNLKTLDLSSNYINYLSKEAQMSIQKLNVTESVDLFLNPLSCSCESLDFLIWIYEFSQFFISFDFYSCYYDNEEKFFDSLPLIISELSTDCEIHVFHFEKYIILGTAFFIVILIILGVVIFNKDWIKFKYYTRKLRLRIKRRDPEHIPFNMEYDVFISYAEEDIDFVRNKLEKELKIRNISVCNHQDHFVPGKTIVENIVYSLEHSRITVCVVTEDFFKSKHCKMEAEWAYTRSKEEDETLHSVFPIFLGGKIPEKYLKSTCFRYMYKTTTVLELTNEADERRCWEKIAALVRELRKM